MQKSKDQTIAAPKPLSGIDRGDLDDFIFSSPPEKTVSER